MYFTGKERDAETGLDYFGARYFGSSQGRFTSPDSQEYARVKEPQSWNLYRYASNNPLGRVDLDGHQDAVGCYASPDFCDQQRKSEAAASKEIGKTVAVAGAVATVAVYGGEVLAFARGLLQLGVGCFIDPSCQQGVANAVAPPGTSVTVPYANEIKDALASSEPGRQLEGQVARALTASGEELLGFRKEIFSGSRRIGEYDIELKNAIIDATVDATGKAGQVGNYVTNPLLNPQNKAVILYGPNMTQAAGRAVEQTGAIVVRNLNELKRALYNINR